MAYQAGQDIEGQGDWDSNPEMRAMLGDVGKKVGEWKTDPDTGIRYIDTKWGRLEDIGSVVNAKARASGNDGNESNTVGGGKAGEHGYVGLGRYKNENGSDLFGMDIDKDGNLTKVGTSRESNRDMNKMLVAMAVLGTAGAAYGAVGGAGAGGAGAAAPGAVAESAAAGAVATPVATPVVTSQLLSLIHI